MIKTIKKLGLGLLIICIYGVGNAQNGILLSGGNLSMQNGASLHIKGADVSLTIESGSTFDARGILHIEGDLNNDGSFNLNDSDSEVWGDLINTGTFNSGTSSFELSGDNNDTVWVSGDQFYDLEVNNSAGNTVILQGDFSVSNQLTMTSGYINTTPSYSITLAAGSTIMGETNDHYVKGNLEATRLVNGSGPVTFGGMGLTIDPATENLGNVTVVRTAGLDQLNVSHKDTLSIDCIWDITPTTQPTGNVDLTLEWLTDNDFGLQTLAQAQVWKSTDNGINWSKEGTENNVSSGRSITLSVGSFSDWTVSDPAAVFPVELLDFVANKAGNSVMLNWATASEINSDYFQVQRSIDLNLFENLGKIHAKGNSTEVSFYEYLDQFPPEKTEIHYRLKMVDLDGSIDFSDIKTVYFDKALDFSLIKVFPSPFSENITVEYSLLKNSSINIELIDLTGKRVYFQQEEGKRGINTFMLSGLENLAQGLYQLRILVSNSQTRISKSVILQR